MNEELQLLAAELALDEDEQQTLRLAFGLACAGRVRHLLEDPRVVAVLDLGLSMVEGSGPREALDAAADQAAALARSHPGSQSIDGCAHAAVSASYAVANALAGRAVAAADYAAYASVYAYAGHAVNDPGSFASEHRWQVQKLRELAGLEPSRH